jgi:hypothetical protein
MKKTSFILLFLSLFLVEKNTAQDQKLIFDNLTYINNQFKQHNDYQTIWAIDYKSEELICFDKFGSYRGKLDEVSFQEKGNSGKILNFKCKSGNCLKQLKESGELKSAYSMGLEKNLYAVIDKFREILNEFNDNSNDENDTNYSTYTNVTKKMVEKKLNRLTEIFQTENEYKHRWFVNWTKSHMYSKTDLCEVYIPFDKGVKIERTDRGYKLFSDSKVIREKCNSFDNMVDKTNNFLNSKDAKEEVFYLFEEILALTK